MGDLSGTACLTEHRSDLLLCTCAALSGVRH
jgi:hypothetical protein